jgi:peptidyl-prolyl cis-trans isomerase SurA
MIIKKTALHKTKRFLAYPIQNFRAIFAFLVFLKMRVFSLLFIFSISLNSFCQPPNGKKPIVLLKVNRQPVFADEFIYLYKKNHANQTGEFTEAKINDYITLFVNFKLKVAEARKLGLDTTKKFLKEFKTYREDLKKPYRTAPDVVDVLAKEAYHNLTQEVRASHILIGIKADAPPSDTLAAFQKVQNIRDRISAGEDFEKLAQELSEDPSAKYNRGDLGYFTAMQMVYPFERAAYETPVGQVSKIVRTRFGYHLIKVIDKKPARGEVEVSHILLRTNEADKQQMAKAKNTIFEIYEQLKAGRTWNDLCKEFSEDPNTKDAGGKLRPFGVGALASVPEFEAMAFAMKKPGDVSDPFQSAIGWHIIKLERKIPLPAYAEMEEQLKKKLARDERVQISQQQLNAKRKRDMGLVEDEPIRKELFALADSSVSKGKWQFKGNALLLERRLIQLSGKDFLVKNFVKFIVTNQAPNGLDPAYYFNQLYQSFVEESMNDVEEQQLVQTKPEFKNLLTEYREGIMFFEIMEREIWNKASEDTIGQKRFYEAHPEKYQAKNRVEARIFTATDKNLINEFKSKVDKGDTISQTLLKKFKSVQPFRKYEKGDSKMIDNVNWVPGLHEIALDNNYYLVEIQQLVAPGLKTFNDAKASIITDYQGELEKQWLEKLKKKYPVSIYNKGRKVVLKELLKK